MALTNMFMLAIRSEFYFIIDKSHDYELDDVYFCGLYDNEKELLDKIRDLETVERVTSLNYYGCEGFVNEDGPIVSDLDLVEDNEIISRLVQKSESVLSIYCYGNNSESPTSIFPLICTDGNIVKELQPNQILLTSSGADTYKIGDKIDLYITIGTVGEFENRRFSSVSVEVVGFIDEDNELLIDSTNRNYNSLEHLYGSVKDDFKVLPYTTYYGIISYFDIDGYEFNFNESNPSLLLINKNEKSTYDSFISDLIDCGLPESTIKHYSELEQVYKNDHSDLFRIVSMVIVIASLTNIVLLASFFVHWITVKQKELSVYVLCGLTLNESLWLSVSPYIIAACIGTLLGITGWNLFFTNMFTYNVISLMTFVGFLGICMLILIIMVLIYSLVAKKKNSIEIYTSRE